MTIKSITAYSNSDWPNSLTINLKMCSMQDELDSLLLNEEEKSDSAADEKKGKKKIKRRGPRLTGISKQRRVANARERKRVHILNSHIDALRNLLPLLPHEKKPTKTETIWRAATYISFLTEVLESSDGSEVAKDEDCMGDERQLLANTWQQLFDFDVNSEDGEFDDSSLESLSVEDIVDFADCQGALDAHFTPLNCPC